VNLAYWAVYIDADAHKSFFVNLVNLVVQTLFSFESFYIPTVAPGARPGPLTCTAPWYSPHLK
jgi:hypothetical protein